MKGWGGSLPINTYTCTKEKKIPQPVVEGKAPVRVKHGERGETHAQERGRRHEGPKDKGNRGRRSVAFI